MPGRHKRRRPRRGGGMHHRWQMLGVVRQCLVRLQSKALAHAAPAPRKNACIRQRTEPPHDRRLLRSSVADHGGCLARREDHCQDISEKLGYESMETGTHASGRPEHEEVAKHTRQSPRRCRRRSLGIQHCDPCGKGNSVRVKKQEHLRGSRPA